MKNAVAYCRYSSDNQRHESIEAQIRNINKFAVDNEIFIKRVFCDEAKTGRKTAGRDDFLEMIDFAKNDPTIDFILVDKIDRFGRNQADFVIYREILRTHKVEIVSIKETGDKVNLDSPDDPKHILIEGIMSTVAEMYSANLSREASKGMYENAITGRTLGGKPPFGYTVNKTLNYEIVENEAVAVRTIFEMYIGNYSYKEISNWLNENGYRTRTDSEFKPSSIHDILKNKKYIGIYEANFKHGGNTSCEIPAIIDEETFNKAQIKLNSKKMTKDRGESPYLLLGKLYCGDCDALFTGTGKKKSGNGYEYYYICKNSEICQNRARIKQSSIDEQVIDVLKERILNKSRIDQLAKAIEEKVKEMVFNNAKEKNKLLNELKAVERKLLKLSDGYLNDLFPDDIYRIKLNELTKEKNKLESQLSIIMPEKDYIINLDFIKSKLYDAIKMINSFDTKIKKAVIDHYISFIKVYSDNHLEIQFKFDTPGDIGVIMEQVRGIEPP